MEFILFIADNSSNPSQEYSKLDIEYDFDDEVYRKYGDHEFGKIKFAIDDFDFINKCSYFDYQRNKVFLRKNQFYRKNIYHSKKRKAPHYSINKDIKIHIVKNITK